MKKYFLVIAQFLLLTGYSYGQRVQYDAVFAPSESFVKPAEKPYRQDICLNGSWQFMPVALPAGFKEGEDAAPALPPIHTSNWDKTPIRIPSPWNVNSFADNNGEGGDFRTFPSYPKQWENVKMGWLKRNFIVPANWKGKHIVLHFEAVAGDAEILVNGKAAGKHFGIFLPFDVDVTNLVNPGQQNEICVGIRKASLFDKNGNYGRRTYQGGSFWGQHIAGIWQDVYLVASAQVHVANVYIKPMVNANRLEAEVQIKNETNKIAEVTLDANAFQWNPKNTNADAALTTGDLSIASSLYLPAIKVSVPANGNIKVVLRSAVNGKLKPWLPQQPNLYGLVVSAKTDGKVVDNKYTRFGWREVTLSGTNVLLNGKPIQMKGDSWHFLGITQMTRRYAAAWYKAMRDANLNTVRLHAQPYPSFYMDVADEMGILVLDETAIWASDGGPKMDDPLFWNDTKNHLSELIMRDRNHPSVFGWSVSNEVMPVITNVMRNPTGVKDTLVKYYGIWADICRKLDPSRQWVSADGEDDGEGAFPAYVVHYGGIGAMERGKNSGKPWGVGEAGNAYYGTPEQVAETSGNRAYESFLGRMEGVAADSYTLLVQQQERNAVYRSVFNMVWYGLKPLPFGHKNTANAPTLNDGVYFSAFKEDSPGVQPERLGPYSSTLNPGYDPSLPLYQTWPLFDAFKDAAGTALVQSSKWAIEKQKVIAATKAAKTIKTVKVLSGAGSTLAADLERTGVPITKLNTAGVPDLLFIDGTHPPAANNRNFIDKVYAKGGTVMVWVSSADGVIALNKLLPAALDVTTRASSSLLTGKADQITSGITASDLYFSELKPAEIITNGLTGKLVEQSDTLLNANHTDWMKWNKQPEYAKTGMVVRSELENVPSGVTLIAKKVGNGRLLVTTLPAAPKIAKAEKLIRALFVNMGMPLDLGNDRGKPLLKDGTIARELYIGKFTVASLKEGADKKIIDPAQAEAPKAFVKVGKMQWTPVFNANGILNLSALKPDVGNNAVAYLSFWVSSQRSLEDLLIEPDMPVVNMEVAATDAVQVYLNGKMVINNIRTGNIESGKAKAEALKLRQGWNHFLIKLIQVKGRWQFSGRLTSKQPDFISTLGSALEKP